MKTLATILIFFCLLFYSCKNEKLKESSTITYGDDRIENISEKLIASDSTIKSQSQLINKEPAIEDICDEKIREVIKFYRKYGEFKMYEKNRWKCSLENDSISIVVMIQNCIIYMQLIENKTNHHNSYAKYFDNGILGHFDLTNQNGEIILFYSTGFLDSNDKSKLPAYLRKNEN